MIMQRLATALLLTVPLLFLGCRTGSMDQGTAARPALSLIPEPQSVAPAPGHFVVTDGTPLVCASGAEDCAWVADYLAGLVKHSRGLQLAPRSSAAPHSITLRLDAKGLKPEAYRLDVTGDGIAITASSRAGLLYGSVTLWQLLTQGEGPASKIDVPGLHIADAPRFAMRGLMLDSARHFQSAAFIRNFIDAMALHKLNVLQWHLTDDQGWRLEIRKYPKLTSVGAWRVPPGAAAAADIDAGTGKPRLYGGFYSQAQVRDIVAYARDRNITIIPEIEMPGHATAAIAAYPQYGSTSDAPSQPGTGWGVLPYLYNVDDSTFGFLEDVLTEVMDLFPSAYIHVGGDEAIKDQWKASAKIQARMHALGVADEDALQGYFTARIGKFLAAHGRHLIGWDEILQGGVPPDATITSWHGVAGGIAAAKMGHDAVLSPQPTLYFDNRQAEGAGEPPGRGLVVPLKDVYAFDPAPASLTPQEQAHIIGIQANLWTEYVEDEETADYAFFPRAAALAEVAWSPAATHDWGNFLTRMPAQLVRYRELGLPHAESAFTAQVMARPGLPGHASVTLANQAAFGEIRYTLDGTAPSAASPLYKMPLGLALPAHVVAAPFFEGRPITIPTDKDITTASLLRRDSHELKQCSNGAMSIRDDGPLKGPRAVFLVNMRNPCWIYEQVDLSHVTSIAAGVGQLPATSRSGPNSSNRNIPVMLPPATPEGELEAHLNTCDGEKVAVLPLGPAIANPGVTALPAVSIAPRTGVHDICLVFTRHNLDPVWAINWVQLGG